MRPNPLAKVRKVSMAACAAAIAASVGLAAAPSAGQNTALDQVQRYCSTSWRNAGIHPQDWQDCTQEAIAQLLERVPQERLDTALKNGETPERRELKRAIWRTIQRWRRAPRFNSIDGQQLVEPRDDSDTLEVRDTLDAAFLAITPRQRQILALWSEGHPIDEIARQLGISAPRASDEKYKALAKMKKKLASLPTWA
jgi:RNA polymerase sigma factor (sigma-70 family)